MDAEAELAREQAHVDRSYRRLEVLREQAGRWTEGVLAQGEGGTHQARLDRDALVHTSLRRLSQLNLGSQPLVFGRLDRLGGERFHIGRVGVPDADLEPLVVDWRAPAAAAFYRATAAEPLGLARRRHFRARGQTLLGLDDEVFADGDQATGGLVLVGEGALLDALRRERTGRMRDIVATIQREQDEVIRAPLDGALVVQGGPGTGKTAVALHRAAYLLYTFRDRLEEAGVLLVGPSFRFLRFIGDVLPGLGEESVRLARLADLAPPVAVTARDAPATARVKGDGRMATVLRRAARGQDLSGIDHASWRHLPAALLRQLYGSRRRVAAAAGGVLSAAEQRLLARPTTAGWTEEDLPLLDELAALLAGRAPRRPRGEDAGEGDRIERALAEAGPLDGGLRSAIRARLTTSPGGPRAPRREVYAHVLVDEAQDLSAMQWRALARRCPSGSMTIVGDLAQATAPGALGSWDAVAALLPGGRFAVRELTVNYRTPAEVAELADRVLAAAAPTLRPPRPVRATGTPPEVRQVPPGARGAAVAEAVAGLRAAGGLVAVLVPAGLAEAVAAELGVAGLDGGHGADVLAVGEAKGLEFDGVVVVEPAAMLREHGLRGLYIALTRATQRLTVLSTEPLPPVLA